MNFWASEESAINPRPPFPGGDDDEEFDRAEVA